MVVLSMLCVLLKVLFMKWLLLYLRYFALKVQSYKLCNNKYMITLMQISNSEIFAVIAVLGFKLLSCKVFFINRKDNRNC